jgi:hypothetical protein
MTVDRRPSVLDWWDELTRGVRPPGIRRRTESRMTIPLGALVAATVLIGVVAFAQRFAEFPAQGVDSSASATKMVATSPSETTGNGPIRVQLLRISDVTLSDDRTTVQVRFGAGVCEDGYEGTTREVDGILEIGIYEVRDPERSHPWDDPSAHVACPMIGVERSIELNLTTPFEGEVVRDLYGQTFWLKPPPWLAVVGGLPEGWELRRTGNKLGTRTPRWERVWSPVSNPDPADGHPIVTLIRSTPKAVPTYRRSESMVLRRRSRSNAIPSEPRCFLSGPSVIVNSHWWDGTTISPVVSSSTSPDRSRCQLRTRRMTLVNTERA